MKLQDHITQRFGALFGDYRKQLGRARKTGSEDAVHDLRVASRRILETCQVFQGAIDADAVHPIRKSLKRWMRGSGTVRDLDIALGLVKDSGLPQTAALATLWREKRTRRWERLLPALRSDEMWKGGSKPETLLPEAGVTLQSGVWDFALSAAQNAALALPLLLDRYTLIGNAIEEGVATDAMYHEFRLRTKRIRYTVESFENLYPRERFRELLAALKGFQQTLGSLQDCAAAGALARALDEKEAERKRGDETLRTEIASFLDFLNERAGNLRTEWHRHWKTFADDGVQTAARQFLREAAADPVTPAKRLAKTETLGEARSAAAKAS